ncbi:eukaryotic translation initiation factor 3 subunit J-like [Physella acuta]|uniref:eukaryotic translation initiation factor 3 subunit J-like n=1 Tax=Physella acuta TaxID=109671 RepID=UPI0027DD8F12|nr:eukaryotic translation initiation factor 3 subunit J-like [Physella acuta]
MKKMKIAEISHTLGSFNIWSKGSLVFTVNRKLDRLFNVAMSFVNSEYTVFSIPNSRPDSDQRAEEEKARTKQKEEEKVEKTPEEKLAEKIRLQKIQEEADLKLTKGIFGVGDASGIDSMYPETKEQFEQALKTKITFFESSKLYSAFIEKLIHDLTLSLTVDDIKRIGISFNTLYHEKERQRREQAKTQKKKKPKATIRVDNADDLGLADVAEGAYYDDDEDDFI